jgi:cobalamin biosynthesis Mg chelatase CobN
MASPGPGVDARGIPVIDPTANVLALVSAAIKRQDDLREQESRHVREVLKVRAAYDKELRLAESARLDAIRAVDASAVQRASDVAGTAASTLASQVTAAAVTLRGQVDAAATAAAAALVTALEPITKSIEDLRRTQYQGVGEKVAQTETRGSNQWIITTVVAIVAIIVTLGVAYAAFRKP